MHENAERLSVTDVDRLAAVAGLTLTPAWRDDLVAGSAQALAMKRLLRMRLDERADAVAAATNLSR
jgi:hypothetical protein